MLGTEEPGRLHTVHEVAKESDTTEWLIKNSKNLLMIVISKRAQILK